MALEKYSLEIEENFVCLCFSLAQQQQHPMPETEMICSSQYQYYEDKTFSYNFWNEKNYTANSTLHDFYVSPDVMENPTYNPKAVSCWTLPDFLTEMQYGYVLTT